MKMLVVIVKRPLAAAGNQTLIQLELEKMTENLNCFVMSLPVCKCETFRFPFLVLVFSFLSLCVVLYCIIIFLFQILHPPPISFLIHQAMGVTPLTQIIQRRLKVPMANWPPIVDVLLKERLGLYPNPLFALETADQLKSQGMESVSEEWKCLIVMFLFCIVVTMVLFIFSIIHSFF
jgi:hypothetical protein